MKTGENNVSNFKKMPESEECDITSQIPFNQSFEQMERSISLVSMDVIQTDEIKTVSILDSSDDISENLGKAMHNKTSREILRLLYNENSLPLSKIAKHLQITVHMAKYHLKPLIAAKLVELEPIVPEDYRKLSIKKREMKWYRIKNCHIIFTLINSRQDSAEESLSLRAPP